MRWLFLMIGGIATAAMLLISVWLNFLCGYCGIRLAVLP